MDYLDYREKLNIGFSDTERTQYFYNFIFNTLNCVADSPDYGRLSYMEYFRFCNSVGAPINTQIYDENQRYNHCISILKSHTAILGDFLSCYVCLINIVELDRPEDGMTRVGCRNILLNALDAAHIPYELVSDGEEYFVFPKGAKELDVALVSQPLEWLTSYPNAHRSFIRALKQYSDGEYIRDAADNMRKALEAFFQEFLGNKKNLETNKNEICKYLGSQNVDASISGLFQQLINTYKSINDSLVKHNDAIDKKLLEFLLYQTGLLIRMVITVKMAEKEATDNAD